MSRLTQARGLKLFLDAGQLLLQVRRAPRGRVD